MADINIVYVNAAFIQIKADPSTLMDLCEAFTYKADNYRFHPKFKLGIWDGNISLINRVTGMAYAGLAHDIVKQAESRNYTVSLDQRLVVKSDVTRAEVVEFINKLNLPEWLEIRDYQIDSILTCIQSKRLTLISPTSSGKSFMIYVIMRWFNEKALIIVPTVGLVKQMVSDFHEYGYSGNLSTSIDGLDKSNDIQADGVVTTWQSLDNGKTKKPKEWYSQFGIVFGDEAHGAKATTLIKIFTNMTDTYYRFGTTGTLQSGTITRATIKGLFGPIYTSTTSRELIDSGYAANIKIKCIVLDYSKEIKKSFNIKEKDLDGKLVKKSYAQEISFINSLMCRTEFIRKLTKSLNGNKLVFFRYTDHGKQLYDSLSQHMKCYYIDGKVDANTREQIRKSVENNDEIALVASLGTTSTGTSIKKLHHMIAAAPQKSETKVPQAIGRMMRQHSEKNEAYLYDIVDNFSTSKSNMNFALKHFYDRVKMYERDGFEYQIYTVSIK